MDSKAFKGKGKGLSKIDASADLTRNEARRKLASNISGCFTKGFKRAEPGCEDEPTRHVCVMGVARSDDGILRDCCQGYGEVSDISRNEKNEGIRVVTFDDIADATAAHKALATELAANLGRRVRVHFVIPAPYRPVETLRCTSETASIEVPGLTLLKDFVDEEQEQELLRHFLVADAHWTGPLRRRVQHYGRVFDYRTRHVDFEVEVPPLPSCLENVLGSMEERGLKPVRPDQLTLNEYKPGQGISPHVDTHSAFEDGLASLSLGSGCVMDMRHPDGERVKNVYLPRGSLLIMEGAARYEWSHGIASRKTDMVCGVVTKRSTRISLTFRRVRNPVEACRCDFEACCDRETPVPTATYINGSMGIDR